MAKIRAGKLVDSAGSANMGADVYSSGIAADITDAEGLAVLALEAGHRVGLQILVDNTDAVGLIYVQESHDGENWVTVTHSGGASIAVATGVDINDTLALQNLGGKYLRVFYDRTSGDGLLDVFGLAKAA